MKNVMTKYIDRLSRTEESKTNEENAFLAKKTAIKVMSQILEIEVEISNLEIKIEDAHGARQDYSIRGIVALEDELLILKRELRNCKAKQKTQF